MVMICVNIEYPPPNAHAPISPSSVLGNHVRCESSSCPSFLVQLCALHPGHKPLGSTSCWNNRALFTHADTTPAVNLAHLGFVGILWIPSVCPMGFDEQDPDKRAILSAKAQKTMVRARAAAVGQSWRAQQSANTRRRLKTYSAWCTVLMIKRCS